VAEGVAGGWAESSLLQVIREHCEIVKRVQQEESRSSAVIPVDVSRSGSILSGEGQKGHYAGMEESRSWVGSVGWKEGSWGMGGRGSFPDGTQSRGVAG
jgi:hypothetical protein